MDDDKENVPELNTGDKSLSEDAPSEDRAIETLGEEILNTIPEEQRSGVLEFLFQHNRTEVFSGPLPKPSILGEYEKVLSGSADRIISMAELEQKHDHAFVDKLMNADISSQETALRYAFTLALLALLSGTFLIAIGRDLAGFAVLAAAIATIVGAFIKREADKRQIKNAAQRKETDDGEE
ncbi:MAG: DUF2335 domain-containing protein [Chloroflexi bacterium]|nr:DUF2335 domain-containing protein [Chloroflexota bacterium]